MAASRPRGPDPLRIGPGYRLDPACDTSVVTLRAPNGAVVRRFGLGTGAEALEAAAREHAEEVDRGVAELDRLLGRGG